MVEPCAFCTMVSVSVCNDCLKPFCGQHHSLLDSVQCQDCEAMRSDFVEEPLIDKEGHRHRGRRIVPKGEELLTSAASIATLSDDELSTWIETYKGLVHEAERTVQHRKILSGILVMEQGERVHNKHSRLMKIRISAEKFRARGASTRRKKADAEKLLELLQSGAIDPNLLARVVSKKDAN